VQTKESIVYQNLKDYMIEQWGDGYFSINSEGHLEVCPDREGGKVDLYSVIQSLLDRGLEAPILFRFDGIIKDRIRKLAESFLEQINLVGYEGSYQPVFPIKVNHQRQLTREVLKKGKPYLMGVEVGSKPELLLSLSLDIPKKALVLCNGYKDQEYISLALMSQKMGRKVMVIVEQVYEIPLILKASKELGIIPSIGLRMKPSTTVSGKWSESSGHLAKFGLTKYEILEILSLLEAENAIDWVELLHFHTGSQANKIEELRSLFKECSAVYAFLKKRCPNLAFLDVGGGLGVDYTGMPTSCEYSVDYDVESYAHTILTCVKESCDREKVPHPTIVSESGRFLTAHHAFLVTEVIDVTQPVVPKHKRSIELKDHPFGSLIENSGDQISRESFDESLKVAHALQQEAIEKFLQGEMELDQLADFEEHYRDLQFKLSNFALQEGFDFSLYGSLSQFLQKVYFCNFSLFRSVPDSWAISQIFPVIPIHRLDEEPAERASIVDLTCDSDGKIQRFFYKGESKRYTHLHAYQNQPYYLGIFLLGAYQETLGSYHNLFGDTHVVHIDLKDDGEWYVSHEIEGDTISEVIFDMDYRKEQVFDDFKILLDRALQSKELSNSESGFLKKKFKQLLEEYTYLVV
jgi:arginine decarboxylase